MIAGQNFFHQPIKNNLKTNGSIQKITTGQRHNSTGCLLDYNYFKDYYQMMPVELSKQQALDADPKAVQRINFTGNLESNYTAKEKESKRNHFRFFTRIMRVL